MGKNHCCLSWTGNGRIFHSRSALSAYVGLIGTARLSHQLAYPDARLYRLVDYKKGLRYGVYCGRSSPTRLPTSYQNNFWTDRNMSTFEERSVGDMSSDETPIGTPIETPIETPNEEMPNPIEDENSPLRQLIGAWSAQKAPFCCGGSIPISRGSDIVSRFEKLTCDDGQVVSPEITLRWDVPGGDVIRKLILPLDERGTGVDDLLKDCAPATFGKGGEEVLDESYRKAVKLDCDQFSSSFNPYDVGIIDAIAQSLLPGIASTFADGKSIFEDDLGIVAELYKLNVSHTKSLIRTRAIK